MATQNIHTQDEIRERPGDDFTRIQGIGPAIAERFNELGVHTFQQVSQMTPEMLAAMFVDMIGISAERIKRQDWIGQARRLAEEVEVVQPTDSNAANNRQHYEVFTVELLLDKDNQVRRTRALHVQSHQERSWAGWEAIALCEFVAQSAGIQDSRLDEVPEPAEIQTDEPLEELISKEEETAVVSVSRLAGEFNVEKTQLISRGEENPSWLIPGDQPYDIRVNLDLSEVDYAIDQPLHYRVTLYGREFKTGAKHQLGEVEGDFALSSRYTVDVRGRALEAGVYRLECLVLLSPPVEIAKPSETLIALSEGKLLHVN